MYAIVAHGGHQYRVAPGDRLLVDQLDAEVGKQVKLANVLVLDEGKGMSTDAGAAHVVATVVGHRRGVKLRVFKYKAKKRNRRTVGHRSYLTELKIDELVAGGKSTAKKPSTKEASEE